MVAFTLTISAILAIIAGLLILIWPKIIRIALGIYLLVIGILGLINQNIII